MIATTIIDHARDVLTLAGYDITETRELPYGCQLRCSGGEIVCIYSTGKVVAQGKRAAAVKSLFEAAPPLKPAAVVKPGTASAAEALRTKPNEDESRRRLPPGWSDVWSAGDIPF